MSMTTFTESIAKQAALAWLESPGWRVTHGLAIALGEPRSRASGLRARGTRSALTRGAGAAQLSASEPKIGGCLRRLTRPEGPELPGLVLRLGAFGVGDQPNINLAI